MTLEEPASSELPAFLVYDTISATPLRRRHHPTATTSFLLDNTGAGMLSSPPAPENSRPPAPPARRKRRRRTKTVKDKDEAETQRKTHIAVERNRRRLMNDHLSMLRCLMPNSYTQRGDQASIVGGAIDFVKELEHLLQSLQVQKRALQQQRDKAHGGSSSSNRCSSGVGTDTDHLEPPFAHFFAYPQYVWSQTPPEDQERRPALADVVVTLVETHASIRILSPGRQRQLIEMVAGLQALRFTILHLNVISMESMVLYSISAKVEDGCKLTTVDDIAAAVHQVLALIDAESGALPSQ